MLLVYMSLAIMLGSQSLKSANFEEIYFPLVLSVGYIFNINMLCEEESFREEIFCGLVFQLEILPV